jgi:glycerophosphoryl diester phosphodiesterase
MIIAAHRGSSGLAPENTLAAFQMASSTGADFIELDVRFSAECTCVVIHDRTVRRTTNGWGQVHKMSLHHLQRLDAGRWFAPRFAGERIPTLSEVLDNLPAEVGLNCEIKTDGDPRSRATRAQALLETLRRHPGKRQLIVSSFDHRFLALLSRHEPSLPLGILLQPLTLARRYSRVARRVGASYIFCSRGMLRRQMVADAKAHGIIIGAYTIDTSAQLDRARRYGVDLVFTNHPERILPWLSHG